MADFGLSSITENICLVNASTPNHCGTVRFRAPELLNAGGAVPVEKGKPTTKSDLYYVMMEAGPISARLSFPDMGPDVAVTTLNGGQPSKPCCLEAPRMTPAAWKIAKECWLQKAKEGPDVNTILESLDNLADPGGCSQSVFLSGVGDT